MMRGMYAAISGLRTHQIMLDTTANDLANVNTIGFKAARTTFADSLAQTQRGAGAPGAGQGGTNAAQIGLGVGLGSIDNLMSSGALQPTGSPLDVAIQGEGWFRIGSATPPAAPTGTIQYTRAGNFGTDSQGYVVTDEGYYVIGQPAGGGPDQLLQVPAGSTNVQVGTDGSVSYIPPGGGARVTSGLITVAKFANEAGLERVGGNRWVTSANSGAEVVGTPGGNFGQTRGGTLEMSNVDLAQEFTNMITAQRGFQANSRVISTSDEMLQDLVNLKR